MSWRDKEEYKDNGYGLDTRDYHSENDFREDLWSEEEAWKKKNSSKSGSSSEGCYIATCVYGSYDCPEVWTLRRFRDNCLATNAAGRSFIRIYYACSPKLVRLFGKTTWFHHVGKRFLDRLVRRCRTHGIPDTPYQD